MIPGWITRIGSAWDGWWFPAGDGLNLAICRIWVVATLLVFFLPPLGVHQGYAIYNDGFVNPMGFVALLDRAWGPVGTVDFVTTAYRVTVVAGLLTILGVATRLSAVVLALAYLFLVTHRYSYGDLHHPETFTAIFLLVLPFTASGDRLSLDAWIRARLRRGVTDARDPTQYAWPLELMQLVIGLAYLNGAWSKLANSGFAWAEGSTLQADLLWMGLNQSWSPALWLAQQKTLVMALATGTLLFEGLFITAVFWRRSTPFWLLVGLAFHLGLVVLRRGDPSFLAYVALYAVFIDFERIVRKGGSPGRPVSSEIRI